MACAGRTPAGGDDDGDPTIDAAPGETPDADPGQPQPDAGPPPGPEPGDLMECLDYQESRPGSDPSWGSVLTDIAQHLPPSYGDQYWFADDFITAGHKTTHGINSDIRNYHNPTSERVNGLYLLGDCAVIVVEPDLRKSDVAPYVPASLRGYRYDTYITGQTAWDDTPTYILDEFVAYTNGGAVGVELVKAGLWDNGWQDGVYGQLEFIVYSLALGMAVREHDPAYFASNTQFKEVLAHEVRRAMEGFREGRTLPDFAWETQDEYYETLRSSAEAAPIREFCADTWGAAFCDELLDLG